MKVLEKESIIFFDVDDTLIMWVKKGISAHMVQIADPYSNEVYSVSPHAGHIKVLKDRSARGSTIIVWSAGGHRWAEAVVKALNLEEYVTLIMSKPFMYVDDAQPEHILGTRLYLGSESEYGKLK